MLHTSNSNLGFAIPALFEEDEEALILLLPPIADKSPEVEADSLMEAEVDEELLEAADMAEDPSGET